MEDAEWWAQQGSLEGCKWEEQEAKKAVDRASKFMKDEKYQRAISLLEKAERLSPGFKGLPELLAVAEVCLAAIWEQCTCQPKPQNKPPDWFRVLKLDEKADSSVIKKRYRQLALLLHPDKNKHVKAEQAFKLVSEAYACLSDKYKRNLFTLGRSKTRCRRCVLTSRMQSPTPSFGYFHEHQQKVSAQQKPQTPVSIAKTCPTESKSDAEKLQMFRERARARVSSLEQAWEARNAKRNLRERSKADRSGGFGDSRDHRSDNTDCFSELRHQLDQMEKESRQGIRDYYNWRSPSRPSHTAEGRTSDRTFTNLKDIGRQKRMQKEKLNVSQSLDDLLNMLRAENSSYVRREYTSNRGEAKIGMKDGSMSARSTEGKGDPPLISSDDHSDSSQGTAKANTADADLNPRAIDKLIADFVRSVDLASGDEVLGVEEPSAVRVGQPLRGADSSSKGKSSTVHSAGVECDSYVSTTPLWGDRRPQLTSDGTADSPMAHKVDGNDLSRTYQQVFEENMVSFSEGKGCTCKTPVVDCDAFVATPIFSEPVTFEPLCTVNQEDDIGELSMTRIGEFKFRDLRQDTDALLVSGSPRSSCVDTMSSKPLLHAVTKQDKPTIVSKTSKTNASVSECQLFKRTAEDSAHRAATSSAPTASSTGWASVRCESLKGGVTGRDPAVHVTRDDDEMGMRGLVTPSCHSSFLKYLPTRAGNLQGLQTGVQQGKPTKSSLTVNSAPGPITEAAKDTEDVGAFPQNESTVGLADARLQATSEVGERLQDSCVESTEDKNKHPEKDAWSFLDLDREQTIMREHKEKSDQLLKTLERLREEAKSVAATLDNLRRTVGTDSEVVGSGFFVNSCHSAPQSLVAS